MSVYRQFPLYLTLLFKLEWLTSVPWPNSAPIPNTDAVTTLPRLKDRSFLAAARSQLDADHFGLEKIKKRLIEYLAVVRLKELNAEREALEELKKADAAAKAKAETEAEGKTEKSTALVPRDKDRVQKSTQISPARPLPRTTKKNIKGPILL